MKIEITLTYDEWMEIYNEAQGHLRYWMDESEAVDKLGEILRGYEEK